MRIDTSFSGKVIQITEALSFQDAVSNQVLALDDAFKAMGLNSAVYTKWHDARHEQRRRDVAGIALTERDIAILHFYGHAEYTPAIVRDLYCTRILIYHNITPAAYFPTNSPTHAFCRLGREQLVRHLNDYHYFWADSQYNLDELIALGAPAERCFVIPIIVDPPPSGQNIAERRAGSWLFVGRIAPNKRQRELVDLFAMVARDNPADATELVLAGMYEATDSYAASVIARCRELGVTDRVHLCGMVSNTEREYLYRRAALYVSLSEHEGFGVPLIEATLRGLPVLALATTAVPETLGGAGLAADDSELSHLVRAVQHDGVFRANLVAEQSRNALRFATPSVAGALRRALSIVLPRRWQFRRVSVVICTYNRRGYLERVLDYLAYQSSSQFEVVVVDGPSDDGTKALLAEHAGHVKIVHNPERNLSKSRNLGIDVSDGDVIAFIDDDALPFDNWIENILAEYNARPLTTAGLGGPAYYAGTFWFQAQDNGINSRAEASINIASDRIGRDGWFRYNTGTNATFSAAVLRQAEGFDEQFDYYLDESEVCFRLQQQGLLLGYSDTIVVRHEFAQSHNRRGGFNYNWHTICKNTAYFVCAYSGLQGTALTTHLQEHVRAGRVSPLDAALTAGQLTQAQRDLHVDAIERGIAQGVADAVQFPRRRALQRAPNYFKPYPVLNFFPSFAAGRRRLHICILSKEFPPFAPGGGIGTLYYHLASELLLMGHVVSVVVPGDAEPFRQGDMRAYFAPMPEVQSAPGIDPGFERNLRWSFAAMSKAAEIHAALPIDVIDSALWDTEALAIALLPRNQRPPVVLRLVTPYAVASDINGWSPHPAVAAQFVEAELALMRCADAVVPISESIAATVVKAYDVERGANWQIIPVGIAYWPFFDVNQGYDDFPQLPGLDSAALQASRLIVFVGRLERRKGIDLIVQAAPRILAAHPDARLVIAGRDVEGWADRIADLPDSAWRARIHLVGEVPDGTRDKLLARAYVSLFPSRYESFGIVPLESFVHGVPVVAARAGAVPEVVEDGISGILFESGNADALAESVCGLLGDPARRALLAEGARRRIRTLGSRPSAIRSEQLYCSLLGD